MVIGTVQVAAAESPVDTGEAVVSGAPAQGFDDTLEAATLATADAVSTISAPTAEPSVRPHLDSRVWVERLLLGRPVSAVGAGAPAESLPATVGEHSDETPSVNPPEKDAAWWEIPIDSIRVPPTPVPDTPAAPVKVSVPDNDVAVVSAEPARQAATADTSSPTVAVPREVVGVVPAPAEHEVAIGERERRDLKVPPGVPNTPARHRFPRSIARQTPAEAPVDDRVQVPLRTATASADASPMLESAPAENRTPLSTPPPFAVAIATPANQVDPHPASVTSTPQGAMPAAREVKWNAEAQPALPQVAGPKTAEPEGAIPDGEISNTAITDTAIADVATLEPAVPQHSIPRGHSPLSAARPARGPLRASSEVAALPGVTAQALAPAGIAPQATAPQVEVPHVGGAVRPQFRAALLATTSATTAATTAATTSASTAATTSASTAATTSATTAAATPAVEVPVADVTAATLNAAEAEAAPPDQPMHESAPAVSRQAAFLPAPHVEQATNSHAGGGESFGSGEGRRSPAAARLAAAIVASGAPAGGGPGTAPVSSVAAPVQPILPTTPMAVTAPMAPTAMPEAEENLQQLIQTMRVAAKSGGWEATVHLKPEHLGEVSISLRVDGRNVSASVQAEAAGVREWLRGQEESVRSGLAEHGLQLERFVVDRDGRQQNHEQAEEQPQRRAPRRLAVPAERFEVVV